MSQPGERAYISIDRKSFYALVECRARGLDPLTTNLVVADESRTDKTICLAVSPSLKTLGISGRPRLFEVKQRIHQLNEQRRRALRGKPFSGSSFMAPELACDPTLEVGYITACPHMRNYMDVSSKICGIYLTYVSEEDMHVYSIDEVFIDVTPYLGMYGMSAHERASPPRRASARTCIWRRWPWTSWPSTCRQMRTAFASRSWTSRPTDATCGRIAPSRTSGA